MSRSTRSSPASTGTDPDTATSPVLLWIRALKAARAGAGVSGEAPKRFTAIVDETALRRVVGDREVQRAQLARLVELAALPHVRLYVVPDDVGAHPGLAGGFVLATLPDGDEVAYVDGVFGQIVDRPDAVDTIRAMWDTLLSEALPGSVSVELIGKLVSEL